jgi:hypothetical protein
LHWLDKAAAGKTLDERAELENRGRTNLGKALETYTEVWRSWAAGERPRRTAIDLYADLFSLKHQLEAEETANPDLTPILFT